MNIHENLDKFLAFSPRIKVAVIACILLIIAATFVFMFWLGWRSGGEWSDSKYLREREERMRKVDALEQESARRIENERQLAAENALLRKTAEAQAEILRNNDEVLRGDARKLTELLEKRNEKFKEIDADADFDNQLCGLCADALRAGFRLSDDFCRRCSNLP